MTASSRQSKLALVALLCVLSLGSAGLARADLVITEGICGELDTELLDGSPHLVTSTAEVRECDYVPAGLSPGGLEVLQDGNAGGSSIYSEILAHEISFECESALLLKTENEIDYLDANGKKTDLLLEIDAIKIGVSVTRAIVFPPGTPLSTQRAEEILHDKLGDVILSSANVDPVDAWQKQILVVETPSASDRDVLLSTYATLDPAVQADTICWIVHTDGEDEFLYFGPEPECDPTPAPPQAILAAVVARNYPNPFNPRTTVEFTLASDARTSVRVFDLKGRVVRTLVDGESLPTRTHTRLWDGRDDSGLTVASGVYLLQVDANGRRVTTRMALLR